MISRYISEGLFCESLTKSDQKLVDQWMTFVFLLF